jgi:MerR family transcriptional regulator, mercuric resistance operon regulatory protein
MVMRRPAGKDALLTRGALAAEAGCNIETIRYYEQTGLLPAPPRSGGGHRLYGPELVKRLHFVRRARELGFTLRQIRELLRLVDGRKYTCAQVEALARGHLEDIHGKIADLERLKAELETLAAQCSGGTIPDCPIIAALFEARTLVPPPDASSNRTRPSDR